MNLRQKIGKVLVKLRKERGLSQEAVSWDVNIDKSYMSGLELGKRNLTIHKIEQITDYYGMKISEFFKMMETIEENGECKERQEGQ